MDKEGFDNMYLNATNLVDSTCDAISSSYVQPWCKVNSFIYLCLWKAINRSFSFKDRILGKIVLYDSDEER